MGKVVKKAASKKATGKKEMPKGFQKIAVKLNEIEKLLKLEELKQEQLEKQMQYG